MFGHDRLAILEKKIILVEERQELCTAKHTQHDEHRRRLDDKIELSLEYQKSTDATLQSILSLLAANIPTIKRARDNYTALDTIKSWAVWVGSVGGSISLIYAGLHFAGVV